MIEALCPPKPKLFDMAACNLPLAGLIGRVVEIALGIGIVQVDRRRNQAVAQRQNGEHQLHAAAGAQQVAQLALGARDAQLAGVLAEDPS